MVNSLSKYKVKKIISCFCEDIDATKTSKLLCINRNTINRYFNQSQNGIPHIEYCNVKFTYKYISTLDTSPLKQILDSTLSSSIKKGFEITSLHHTYNKCINPEINTPSCSLITIKVNSSKITFSDKYGVNKMRMSFTDNDSVVFSYLPMKSIKFKENSALELVEFMKMYFGCK